MVTGNSSREGLSGSALTVPPGATGIAAASMIPFEKPGISGVLHRPDGASEAGLVLTHGAGGNRDAPLLVAVAEAFSAAGVSVLRCDLPFRQRRKSGPPAPASAAAD